MQNHLSAVAFLGAGGSFQGSEVVVQVGTGNTNELELLHYVIIAGVLVYTAVANPVGCVVLATAWPAEGSCA